MERLNIAQLSESPLSFEGVYRLSACQQRVARTGKKYLRLTIEDATGTMIAYAWKQPGENNAGHISCSTHLHLRGKSRYYNGIYVADILSAEPINPLPFQGLATLPSTQCPVPKVLSEFTGMVLNIQHGGLRRLLIETFSLEQIVLPFMQVPASLKYHHNYSGGLLVHSMECAEIISDLSIFSQQDKELGITAALLHDLGKIKTIGIDFSRPELGKAIDHEAISLELCAPALAQLDISYPELGIDLRHILTCRSVKRWGREAKHPIAYALQLADRISADNNLHQACSRNRQRHLRMLAQA